MSLIHRYDKLRNKIKITTLLILVNIFSANLLPTKSDNIGVIYPVLASPMNSRARVTETAKDFPVLLLLANKNNHYMDVPRMGKETELIYVEVRKLSHTACMIIIN